jgi:hypothetical protein
MRFLWRKEFKKNTGPWKGEKKGCEDVNRTSR